MIKSNRRRAAAIGIFVLASSLPTAAFASTAIEHNGAAPKLIITKAPWHLQQSVSRSVAVAIGSSIELMSGLQISDTSTNAVWDINPQKGTVTSTGTLNIAVHDAGGALIGGHGVVFGGGSFTTQSAVQQVSGGITTQIGSLPVPRSDLAGASIGNTAYVIGGFDGTNLVAPILATNSGASFRTVGHLVQPVRYPAVAVNNGDIFIVGGELSTTEGTLAGPQTSDIQRFDPRTGKTTVIGHLPVPLGHEMAAVLGHHLYIFGGRIGANLSSAIWSIDTSTGKATNIGRLSSPRSDASTVVIDNVAYVIGGETTGPAAPLNSALEVRLKS